MIVSDSTTTVLLLSNAIANDGRIRATNGLILILPTTSGHKCLQVDLPLKLIQIECQENSSERLTVAIFSATLLVRVFSFPRFRCLPVCVPVSVNFAL